MAVKIITPKTARPKVPTINDLAPGATFMYQDTLFMVMEVMGDYVCLENGEVVPFEDDTQIQPVDLEIKVIFR